MESSGCMMSGLLWSVEPWIHFSVSWFLGLHLCWLTAKERKTALLNGILSLIRSSNSQLIHWCWFSLPVFQLYMFFKSEQVEARNSSLPLLCTRPCIDTVKGTEKIISLWEERGKKLIATGTWFCARHYFLGFRSIIIYFFLPTLIWGRCIALILWMRKLRLRQASDLSRGLLNFNVPIPHGLTDQCPQIIFSLQRPQNGA